MFLTQYCLTVEALSKLLIKSFDSPIHYLAEKDKAKTSPLMTFPNSLSYQNCTLPQISLLYYSSHLLSSKTHSYFSICGWDGMDGGWGKLKLSI